MNRTLAARASKLVAVGNPATQDTNGPQNAAESLLDQPQSDFQGVAVMLLPSEADQQKIANVPGVGVQQDNLHCTLVFLGDAKALDRQGYSLVRIADDLRHVAAGFPPIEATLGGVTRFSATKGNDPVVLNVDSKTVHQIRDAVLAALEKDGVQEDTEHGYTPHLTIGYVPTKTPNPFHRWDSMPVTFDRIRIGYGGDDIDLGLGNNTMEAENDLQNPDADPLNGNEPVGSFGTKDVYEGMPGLIIPPQREKPVQRAKRYKLKHRAAKIVANHTENHKIKHKSIFDRAIYVVETKTIRHVRTPAGEHRYGQPIGSIIVADGENPLKHIHVTSDKSYPGWTSVEDNFGHKYDIGPDPYDGGWAAMGEGGWDDTVVSHAKNAEEAYRLLDQAVAKERKPGSAPVIGSLGKKTDVLKKRATAAASGTKLKKDTKKVKQTNRRITKQPQTKTWQKPWDDLTPEEQQKLIGMRGKIPDRNPLTKQPWTPAAIKKKRQGRTEADMIKRAKKAGWRLVTDDKERHEIGRQSGRPIPPAWSHILVYEGADAADRKTTIQGLDWAFKLQPHQTSSQRGSSLDEKFTRYRALTKKLPTLDRRTKKDLEKDDTALVVRIMMLSGGRVDSQNGRNVTGSRGITSLLKSDIKTKGNRVYLQFDAKSGHRNDYEFVDKAVAERLRAILSDKKPSEQAFPTVESNETAAYIKKVCGKDFTNHDLRTAVANAAANKAISNWIAEDNTVDPEDPKAVQREIKKITTQVGVAINDTPTTAYNSYIDPAVFAQMGIPADKLPARGAK